MKTAASLSCVMALYLVTMGSVGANAQAAPKTEMSKMTEHVHAPAPLSTSLTVTVDGKATTLSIAELQGMPQKTLTVPNEHKKRDESYAGVLLGDLLAKYGFPAEKATQKKMLRSYLVAEGTDKYWVLYSVTEVEGSEHNCEVIVATSGGGKPLGADGQFKLIDTADRKPQRWVRNLKSITVKSAE